MPELPDLARLPRRDGGAIVGQPLSKVRLASPFVLRSVDPPPGEVEGKVLRGLSLLGKRVVFSFDEELYAVIHLMVSGRFAWAEEPGAKIPGRVGLLAMDFPSGTLILREASKKKRASLHFARGEESLEQFDRGGIDVLGSTLKQFTEALLRAGTR